MAGQSIQIIKDDRARLDQIIREVRTFKRSYVKVGVLEGTARRDGTPMAMIAAVHEYGSDKRRIPQRSFIRGWVFQDQAKIQQFIARLVKQVEGGQLTATMALHRLGVFGVGGIRKKITDGPFIALRPATIARKGSSAPLLDTGQLRASINYKVVVK